MCGIFGIVCNPSTVTKNGLLKKYIKDMFLLSSTRGKEASGLAINFNNNIGVLKKGLPCDLFLKNKDYAEFLEKSLTPVQNSNKNISIIGHTRLSTNGSANFELYNHPIIADKIVGIHNGVITDCKGNDASAFKDTSNSDSGFLFNYLQGLSKKLKNNYIMSLQKAYQDISGSASIAFFVKDQDSLFLASNTGSLYLYKDYESKTVIFFSERRALEVFLSKHHFKVSKNGSICQVNLKNSVLIDLEDCSTIEFNLLESLRPQKYKNNPVKGKIDIFDVKKNLIRCSKCVLPNTYPYIKFDAKGVCNYCTSYNPDKLLGHTNLKSLLNKYRKSNGEPDCIVAFSGGRDSSYGLHVLKREFNMNPIAFSYDWGMATDGARRNQARMTGKLGLEQIIRTENLLKKRRYLRKNIQAWFRSPHLGMVPLFMAGDKFFFDIARELRKELKIPLVIFCGGNELERTDFKSGFAGVKENNHQQRLFAFSALSKINLGLFYLLQYLKNPYYLNESLLESLLSFKSTFLSNDDFIYLYHYLRWDEKKINETLVKEYDWEVSDKSDNTWRIGDGHTAFINYIYHSIAGFSEYDAFRSQQIRKGLISREEALYLIEKDNMPDIEALKVFSLLVGISFEEMLYKINLIPKLY